MLTPHRPNELGVRGHQDRPLQPQELLMQIQETAVGSPMKHDDGMPYQLPGRYLLDDRIHVAEGQRSDWVLAPIKRDPAFQQATLWMPKKNRRQLQTINRKLKQALQLIPDGTDVKLRYFIVHELPSRGHKKEIEQSQRIPIELIEPISPQRAVLEQSWIGLKWAAPKLAIAFGVVLCLMIAAVIIATIAAILMSVLVLVAIVVGAAAVCGTDPIILMALEHEDGTSSIYQLTSYEYLVRRWP